MFLLNMRCQMFSNCCNVASYIYTAIRFGYNKKVTVDNYN